MHNQKFNFRILHQSKKSNARIGILKTPHGEIKTPAFVTVGTKASVKSLTPEDLDSIGSQFIFTNTYHLVLSPGLEVLKKTKGIHKFSKINKPIISDSGGFQVFSLARNRFSNKLNKELAYHEDRISLIPGNQKNKQRPILVKITNDGVKFRSHIDGKEFYFTPEFSVEAQKIIGADFIVAFDECIYYRASEKYTKKSLERTHHWAIRSLSASKLKSQNSNLKTQKLYGVIQGGTFEDLRQKSAKFITSLPFWGIAIGGVSVGETKKEMRNQVSWVMKILKNEKRPIHLLGIGHLDDIVNMVKLGIDSFDCVIPTRHARMGKFYINDQLSKTNNNQSSIDIFQAKYKNDMGSIKGNCHCYTCLNFSRSYLHHLFKQKELLAYRLATIHNLTFIENFFKKIRNQIINNKL